MSSLLSILQSASSSVEMQQIEAPSPAIMMFAGLIFLAVMLVGIAAGWKVFTKAGEPGWASLVPIYNIVVTLKMTGKPLWWLLLFLIPGVNLIMFLVLCIALAKSFGQGVGFGLGLFFLAPIFFLILAFGSAQYQGPRA